MILHESPLGKSTVYRDTYSSDLLFPVSRRLARDKLGIDLSTLPFEGPDIWNAYELSWLNPKGKPEIALGEFVFPCTTPNIVESKSLKLYLNSFNQTVFKSFEEVRRTIEKDLSEFAQGSVSVNLYSSEKSQSFTIAELPGICLDTLEIETSTYHVDPKFLITSSHNVEEKLYSNLLKSNCLATGQPDWGSLYIHYAGPKIDREGLLKYIISHRGHGGFAEYCVEQIFCDILRECKPKRLTVYARYTRRGGLDINPFRSNFEPCFENQRQWRQ